jgi:hypothetical protein
MCFKVTGYSEGFPTWFTSVGFLSSVISFVGMMGTRIREGFPILLTCIGSLSRVSNFMSLKASRMSEGLTGFSHTLTLCKLPSVDRKPPVFKTPCCGRNATQYLHSVLPVLFIVPSHSSSIMPRILYKPIPCQVRELERVFQETQSLGVLTRSVSCSRKHPLEQELSASWGESVFLKVRSEQLPGPCTMP